MADDLSGSGPSAVVAKVATALVQEAARTGSTAGGEEARRAAAAVTQSAAGLQGNMAGVAAAASPGAQVRQVAQAAAAGLRAAALGGKTRDDVSIHLEIDGVDGVLLGVREATIFEELNAVASAVIEVRCDGTLPELRDLLHHDCALSIERNAQSRSFRGVVQHAEVHGTPEGTVLTLRAVPAMAYLEHIVDTRIYQDMTVLDVIQDIFDEKLSSRTRQVRNECGTHDVHEYLVQYNESCLAFVQRLLEREGIFYYFDHEGDHETLVLADAVSSCSPVRGGEEIPFATLTDQAPEHEAITSVHHTERIGSISAVVSGYDWTNPTLPIHAERAGSGESELPLERYAHRQAVTHHDYQDGQYRAHSADGQAQLRAARLDQHREQWKLAGTVVTAQPGRTFTLSGAPEPSFDGRYLILQSRTVVVATEGTKGSLVQDMEIHPADRPYAPPCKTPVPIIHGMELATVVGPNGAEIHTDEHGRIKVQFPWDRRGENNQESSCWIRVAQMWGGVLWGTHFTPRVGMEVIVSFLGGHPDRPVVIGSLYNGSHRPPYAPQGGPVARTKGTIRTNSTPGGSGFNPEGSDEDFWRQAPARRQ